MSINTPSRLGPFALLFESIRLTRLLRPLLTSRSALQRRALASPLLRRAPTRRDLPRQKRTPSRHHRRIDAISAPFILAAGFTGARLDHGLAAFHALVRHPGQRCILLGGQDICFLAPKILVLDVPKATRLSLFPLGPVAGRSTGLRWPINGLAFAPDRLIGTSNETIGPVRLSFDAPVMLVILPIDCLRAALAALMRDA